MSGAAAGCYYLFTCPQLKITSVKVRGTNLINSAALAKDVEFAVGRNILIISRRQIASRIAKWPEVKDVTIGRVLPRTLVVRVQERRPYMALTNGSSFWLADETGLPFHQVNRIPKSVPLATFPPEIRVRLGHRITHSDFSDVMRCIQAARAIGCPVHKISVDRTGNLCLNMGSEFYVKLGQPVEIREKLETVSKILTARPDIGEKALYIDVSCNERPVWKPKLGPVDQPISNT
jgi:hypothetical protein